MNKRSLPDRTYIKQRDWRRATVYAMGGFLAAVLLWVLIMWAAIFV
ncbi:hypothetical protein ACFQ88_20375 [Paenibacillus sp. NPDC056579]